VETYPLWECPNKEAALRELLEMNSTTFWNQIVVEDQDQMTDSQDLKEQAAIGATDSKTGHDDDLGKWVSTLNDASDVVKDDDLALFPLLEHSDESMQLSQCFLDEFVNVNSLGTNTQPVNDDSNVPNFLKDAVADNFDVPFVSKLNKSGLDEEVTAAAQLLTTEDEQIAEEMVSYLVSESDTASPEMNHQSVDDILNELLNGDNYNYTPTSSDVEVMPAPTDFNILSQILTTNPDSVSSTITVDNFDFPDTQMVDERVINEFANLLNAFDDSLNSNSATDGLCDKNVESVDNGNSSASPFISAFAQVHEEVIEESVNSPTSSLCTVDDIPDSNAVNDRCKRKRSNTTNDEDNVAKKIKRRIKNNEASKVTRAKRRNRHQELFETERKLADSNNELRMKLEVMQREADILRQLLIVTLSNANSK